MTPLSSDFLSVTHLWLFNETIDEGGGEERHGVTDIVVQLIISSFWVN